MCYDCLRSSYDLAQRAAASAAAFYLGCANSYGPFLLRLDFNPGRDSIHLESWLPVHIEQAKPRIMLTPKSFRCNTSWPSRMCCNQRTCVILKFFRCNTYKKYGGGHACLSTALPPRGSFPGSHPGWAFGQSFHTLP